MNEHSMDKRLEATVFGRVQGVGFRYSTQAMASSLHLKGWVANRFDGSVRVVAEGSEPVLMQLTAWLREGPRAAYVEQVEVRWMEPTGEFAHFGIR